MTASCLLLTILAQATTFTVLVVILHHFFEIFPCFHYQTVLITDAKVIYYIDTAIRANGDLRFERPFHPWDLWDPCELFLVFKRTFKVLQHLMFRILLGKISVFRRNTPINPEWFIQERDSTISLWVTDEPYSTVTLFARFLGISTSSPLSTAT